MEPMTKDDCLRVLEYAGTERFYVRTERCIVLQVAVELVFARQLELDSRVKVREATRKWLVDLFLAKATVAELEGYGADVDYDAILQRVINLAPVHPFTSSAVRSLSWPLLPK